MGQVGPEEMGALQKTLRGLIEQLEECAVCFDQLKEPRIVSLRCRGSSVRS